MRFRQFFRRPGHKEASEPLVCLYPGCEKPVFPESKWCSKGHRDLMRTNNHAISELSESDPKYKSVLQQCQKAWRHNCKPCPPVHAIFRIRMPQGNQDDYNEYKARIVTERGLPDGNECRRFHGTKRACNLGENGCTTLCEYPNCSLCGIIRSSFKLELAGTHRPWRQQVTGRFGRGIYTSATSSKSDDYSYNVADGRGQYKAMLLTKVVVGKGKKLTAGDSTLTSPPEGYDSVIGEKSAEGELNHDELVVYNSRAVIPAYLIIYGRAEPAHARTKFLRVDGQV